MEYKQLSYKEAKKYYQKSLDIARYTFDKEGTGKLGVFHYSLGYVEKDL